MISAFLIRLADAAQVMEHYSYSSMLSQTTASATDLACLIHGTSSASRAASLRYLSVFLGRQAFTDSGLVSGPWATLADLATWPPLMALGLTPTTTVTQESRQISQ